MSSKRIPWLTQDRLTQIAGLTGVGWTASILGFISTAIGYGNGFLSRLFIDPQSFLYLGIVFFLATLGLDQLADALAEGDR